jgi:hypothetical protein
MDDDELDFEQGYANYLAEIWNENLPFSQIGPLQETHPEDSLKMIKDQIELNGFYSSTGEMLGMGNVFTMRISKEFMGNDPSCKEYYLLSVVAGEDHIKITAKYEQLDHVFASARVFISVLDVVGWSYSLWKKMNKYNVRDIFPLGNTQGADE